MVWYGMKDSVASWQQAVTRKKNEAGTFAFRLYSENYTSNRTDQHKYCSSYIV